jgi:hypothetical protein
MERQEIYAKVSRKRTEDKRELGRSSCRREANIKLDLNEIGYDDL